MRMLITCQITPKCIFSLENTMSGNRNLLLTYIKDLARGVGQTLALKSYVLLTFIVYRTSLVIINY